MMAGKFSTNACYAAIKAGFIDNNADNALLRIVLGVIEIKHYSKVDIRELCNDFKREFDFEIPYFPMQRILSLAIANKYLTYNGMQEYVPNYSEICKENFMGLLAQKQQEYNKVVASFISFVSGKHNVAYSTSEASNIIDSFVEENGILFYCNHKVNLPQHNYLFSEFLLSTEETNPDIFEYVDSLIVGRILSEFVTYHEPTEKASYNEMVAYIDTGFAFRLLGIDNLNRQAIYKSLVDDMKGHGIEVKMFDHSYNEMIGIINNSSMWIDNPNYDPSKASEATYYFVSNNYSSNKITEISLSAKQDLSNLGVTVDGIDYPQALPLSVFPEKDMYDKIVEYYTQTNPKFDEQEKKYTVEQDARSFFYINYLCKGIVANQISDIKYVFITTNKSLSRISKNIISQFSGTSASSIPFCVTDVFWGTVLWANTPTKLLETSKARLASELYSAFIPSEEMLNKLTKSLAECEAKGLLTAEECYMLKASKLANRTLVELTLGNDEAFEDKTPIMILQDIQSKAKEQGAKEERQLADIEIKEKDQEILKEKCNRIDSNIREIKRNMESQKKQTKLLEDSNLILTEKLDGLKGKANKAQIRININVKIIIALFIVILVLYAGVGFFIWLNQKDKDYFGVYKFIAPLIVPLFGYMYFGICGKSFNPLSWAKNYKKTSIKKYYKKYGYDQIEYDSILEKLATNEELIRQTQQELSCLLERLLAFETEEKQIQDVCARLNICYNNLMNCDHVYSSKNI